MTENKKTETTILLPICLAIGVILIWAGTWWGVFQLIPPGESDWAKRGQFGDLFGSVNALFSGLAFVSLIYTIYLQRLELALQREELSLQRIEMAASREELAAQVKAQKDANRISIGQIKIAAEQARIESAKLKMEGQLQPVKDKFIKDIETIAEKIDEIANALEKQE